MARCGWWSTRAWISTRKCRLCDFLPTFYVAVHANSVEVRLFWLFPQTTYGVYLSKGTRDLCTRHRLCSKSLKNHFLLLFRNLIMRHLRSPKCLWIHTSMSIDVPMQAISVSKRMFGIDAVVVTWGFARRNFVIHFAPDTWTARTCGFLSSILDSLATLL